MNTKIKSATIFFYKGTKRPRKYRNVTNEKKFEDFAEKSGGIYINYYNKIGEFLYRKWIKNFLN